MDQLEKSESSPALTSYIFIISMIIMLGSVILYFILAYKVYNNNKSKIFPVHIFQINYFLGVAAALTIGILLPMLQKIRNYMSIPSCYHNYVGLIFWCSSSFDIIIMQLDRFLAIRKPFWHRSEVTNSVCIRTCLFTKFVAFLCTVLACFVTHEFYVCPEQLLLLNTLPGFVLCNSTTKITALLVTVMVSIYVTIKSTEFKNKVQPFSTAGLQMDVFSTPTSGQMPTLKKETGRNKKNIMPR